LAYLREKTAKGNAMRRLWLAARLVAGLGLIPLPALAGQAGDVSVQQPWMRYLLPSVPAGGYLTLVNNSDNPATLTGASALNCAALMLHQSMNMGGTSMMMPVASVPVPAHGQAQLTEGGYHLMCMDPKMKVGEKIAVTLTFGDGSSRIIAMPVYGATGAP
jgi:periplasmic copper chaperone A